LQHLFNYRMSRRSLLGTAAALALGARFLGGDEPTCASPAPNAPALNPGLQENPVTHNVWVWRFGADGPADQVLDTLKSSGAGLLLKTHEGVDWMSRYDRSSTAINGPQRVRELVEYFESAGVPFHAWGVVRGVDPIGEAQICAEVLNCGARSMIFDLEPPDGGNYWQGDPGAALALGEEIRRLQPDAQLGVAPDARPWQIDKVPMAEFASFTNEILPQTYWQIFNSPTNHRRLSNLGYHIGPEGVTPELILDATADKLRQYGRPIRPIGEGTAPGAEWARFIGHAYWLQMDSVSVWRFGTAHAEVWPALLGMPPVQPAPISAAPEPAAPTAQPEQIFKYVEPPEVTRSGEPLVELEPPASRASLADSLMGSCGDGG
jgi:hypothetical protein